MDTAYMCIGRIGRPCGWHGHVHVIPLTDFPQRFERTRQVYVRQADQPPSLFKIEQAAVHGSEITVKFAGLDSREAAGPWQGALLEVAREEAEPLPEGSWYICDLIGAEVSSPTHGTLGRVADVLQLASNDILVVTGEDGREVLVPMIGDVVKRVDVAAKRIEITVMKGLLD
jgi:16S rRNA processing protein RimM